ncbi:MAG TPA: metal-dependent hydrolase [Fredinandcohnia sp.]|nr:metal-dependent hydrolase [Fredinandcohnia sp.]
MDPITHSLVGLHLARRPALRGLPAAPRLLLALSASLAPDVDRHLLAPFREALLPLGPAGILHSLPGAALTACLLAAVARPLVPAEGRRAAAVLAALAVALHLIVDALTADGLPLAWPLASDRVGLAWLASPDPWLWFLLALPLLGGRLRRPRERRVLDLAPTRSGVVPLVLLYLGICAVTKARAELAAERFLPDDAQVETIQAYPLGPGPLLWAVLARTTDETWHRARFTLAGGLRPDGSLPTGATDPRMQIALDTREGRAFLAMARAPFLAHATEVAEDGSFEVGLGDLRFGDPARGRLSWVLWLRLDPTFSPEEWRMIRTPLPP